MTGSSSVSVQVTKAIRGTGEVRSQTAMGGVGSQTAIGGLGSQTSIGEVSSTTASDEVVAEAPLEIRIASSAGAALVPDAAGSAGEESVAVTMRTPGADRELAIGFLFAEGLISGAAEVVNVTESGTGISRLGAVLGDSVTVVLQSISAPATRGLERHFVATSSCGVCGKAGLEQLAALPIGHTRAGFQVNAAVLLDLPARLRAAQAVFTSTGGLHAAAAFDAAGDLIAIREDIGRHNAIDKLVGWALIAGYPLSEALVMVSGRASFEVVQKCLRAEVPLVAAVSAPSSLAIDTAYAGGQTLVGFLSENRFNAYTHPERIVGL